MPNTCCVCGERTVGYYGPLYKVQTEAGTYEIEHRIYCQCCCEARYHSCDNCGKVHTTVASVNPCPGCITDDTIVTDDPNQLELPDMPEKQFKCCNCSKLYDLCEQIEVDNETYCEDCHSELFWPCEECGCNVLNDDIKVAKKACDDESYLCEDCFDSKAYKCDDCGESYLMESVPSYETSNGYTICEDCYENNYFTCEGCSSIYHSDHICSSDGGCYCEFCMPEQGTHSADSRFKAIESTRFKRNPSKRSVGFEIEAFTDESGDFTGLGCIHGDGSIRPDRGKAFELATHHANGDALLTLIDKVYKALRNAGADVNNSCGLHVHLDMNNCNDAQRKNIFNAWKAFEPLMFCLVPSCRRDNQYCGPTRGYYDSDRYVALNPCSLSEHGTFEVRLHQGTTNKYKLRSWILFLVRFFDTFEDINVMRRDDSDETNSAMINGLKERLDEMTPREQFRVLLQMVKLPLSVAKGMTARLNKYNTAAKPRGRSAANYHFSRTKATAVTTEVA